MLEELEYDAHTNDEYPVTCDSDDKMPRARNREPSPEGVEEEEQDQMQMEGVQPLQFDEAITWKPGKAIPVAELLRRLKTLSEELKSIEQELADRESLSPKAQELANGMLLGHKDKGVRAYALLCIVEMFRLLAPDAPFKQGQLKDIFTLFTSHVVPALGNPSDPYNQQHMDILVSLTNVKSIALVTDINGSENMMLTLFTNCFDVMSGTGQGGEKLPKNLEYHLTSMLCTLIEECSPTPSGVVDIILAQFLRADPNALSGGKKKGEPAMSEVLLEPSPAYNMARSVCNTCADPMDRAIGQYFSSVLIDASETFSSSKAVRTKGKKRTHAESEDESEDDGLLPPPAEADLQEVGKAHRLLRELWRSSPDVVQNIVPQLEAEIEGENADLRALAVQTIGDMCAGIGAAGPPPVTPMDPAAYPPQSLDSYTPPPPTQNVMLLPAAPHAFSSVYPNAYSHFATRYKDKAVPVRSAFASAAGRILLTSGGGKGLDAAEEDSLLKHLSDLLQDQDEKVRLAAVQTIANFDFPAVLQRLCKNGGVMDNGTTLCNLAERIKDPKRPVRDAAIDALGRIWGVAAGAIGEGSELVRQRLGSIPSKILDAMYLNNKEVNSVIYRTIYERLLPVSYPPIRAKASDSQRVDDSQPAAEQSPDPDTIRAERILVLVRDLEGRSKTAWDALQSRTTSEKAKYLETYLKTSEELKNGGASEDTKKNFEKIVRAIATFSTDPEIAVEHLKKFAKHHDRRSFQLMRFCWSPESDYRKIQKSMKELTKRMDEAQSGMPLVLETLMPLLRMASILVYNKSHVHPIVEISRTDEKGLGSAAQEVLKEISTHAPGTFKAHVHELCETLQKQTPSAETEADATVVETLKACANFARRYPKEMPKDRDFHKAMVSFATQSTLPKAAKHAVTVIIASADKKEMYIKDIKKACIDKFKYSTPGFVARLAAISQLRLLASKDCEDKADKILEIAANEVLGQVRSVAGDAEDEWVDDIDDDLGAKLWALKVLVNGLRGFMDSVKEDTPEQDIRAEADPVYRLLNQLVESEGELANESASPSTHKAHLRLAAAIQLLKLSRHKRLDPLMLSPTDFVRLSRIAQDPLPQVRAGFVNALKKNLASKALPSRFYPLVFLYAYEPNRDVLASTTTWLKSRAALSEQQQDTTIDAAFVRFLSLLAHHQDFNGSDAKELEDFVGYILFYLKTAASQANLPRIYHLAQRLKQVQDAIDPAKTENLYVLSDIAEAVIRLYQEAQGWSLQLMSAKSGLPSGLFRRLPSHAEATRVAETRYIPEDLADRLEDIVKESLRTKKRKADGGAAGAAKKAKKEKTAGREKAKKTSSAAAKKVAKPAKTPKKVRKESTSADPVPSSERRKSTRKSGIRTYAEHDDSEDDEELEGWQAGAEPGEGGEEVEQEAEEEEGEGMDVDDEREADEGADADSEGNKENEDVGAESTPPTSRTTSRRTDSKGSKAGKAAKGKEANVSPPAKKAKGKKEASKAKAVPVRGGRATRTTRATRGKKERDVMSLPSDSDEEMGDAEGGAEVEA